MMKRLLAVFAHPDDESIFAGTLAHYSRQGVHVALACATRGEAGEISDPSLASPTSLGTKREAELRCSCDVIGVADLHLLGYCDSGMEGTPDNDRPTAFIQAEADEVLFKFVKLMREIRPQVVITFEPHGWYGHPDHVAASSYATEAYQLASDPAAFPRAGRPWRPDRLFYAAFLPSQFKSIIDYARDQGLDTSDYDTLVFDEPDRLAGKITHALDVRALFDVKNMAMRCHETQFGENNLFLHVSPEVLLASLGREWFIQADPSLEPSSSPASDLFAGISG